MTTASFLTDSAWSGSRWVGRRVYLHYFIAVFLLINVVVVSLVIYVFFNFGDFFATQAYAYTVETHTLTIGALLDGGSLTLPYLTHPLLYPTGDYWPAVVVPAVLIVGYLLGSVALWVRWLSRHRRLLQAA